MTQTAGQARRHDQFIDRQQPGDVACEATAFASAGFALSLFGWDAPSSWGCCSQRGAFVSRIAIMTILIVALGAPGVAQPCNPAIDGTYCASQPKSRLDNSLAANSRSNPSIGGVFFSSVRGNDPATLGAITFQSNGTRCVGLLRRSSCN